MKTRIKATTPVLCVRSITNDGDKSKQYFQVITQNRTHYILINQRVLTKNLLAFNNSFTILKIYKGYFLLERNYGMKMSTLNKVFSFLNKYNLIK